MAEQIAKSAVGLDVSTRLAFARTRVAYERTMMAWIRTATSLITFGFSIYKFFQIARPADEGRGRLIGARGFAFLLVIIGLLALVLATVENRRNISALRAESADDHRSLAVLLAALISLLGMLALIVMVLRQ